MHDVSHMDRDRIGGRDGSDDRVREGTYTNTVKGQSPTQLAAGTVGMNGPEVEHEPANETSRPVVLLTAELIKK